MPNPPMGIPSPNLARQVRGNYLKLGILVRALVNAGEPLSEIAHAVRSAEVDALHDGIGQEA